MNLKKIVLGVVFCFSVVAQAEFVEGDGEFIYVNKTFPEAFASKESTALIMSMASKVFTSGMVKLAKNGILPEEVESFSDLEKYDSDQDKMEKALEAINKWTAKAKDRLPFHAEWSDALPSGVFVTLGGKISGNLGFGVGTSFSIGAVIVPVLRQAFSKVTGELVSETKTVDVNFVVWPAPSVGVGANADSPVTGAFRVGAGLFWSIDRELDDADDFKGYGFGPTSTISIGGIGINLKAGVVNSSSLKGFFDLIFVSASFSKGTSFTGEGELHLSANIVIPMEKMFSLLSDQMEDVANDELKAIEKNIEKEAKEIFEDIFEEPKKINTLK